MADLPSFTFRLEESEGNVHLYGPKREHDTDTLDCWCRPTLYRICDECEDGCWRCDNGRNEITLEQAAFCEEPLLVVHRL